MIKSNQSGESHSLDLHFRIGFPWVRKCHFKKQNCYKRDTCVSVFIEQLKTIKNAVDSIQNMTSSQKTFQGISFISLLTGSFQPWLWKLNSHSCHKSERRARDADVLTKLYHWWRASRGCFLVRGHHSLHSLRVEILFLFELCTQGLYFPPLSGSWSAAGRFQLLGNASATRSAVDSM